jgi:hypothetical protein
LTSARSELGEEAFLQAWKEGEALEAPEILKITG